MRSKPLSLSPIHSYRTHMLESASAHSHRSEHNFCCPHCLSSLESLLDNLGFGSDHACPMSIFSSSDHFLDTAQVKLFKIAQAGGEPGIFLVFRLFSLSKAVP